MAGHSKWHNIQARKQVVDAKKGSLFTKLARNIMIAAKEFGGDMETNFKLRLAVEKARQVNMPKDNIERAIKKGTGELEGEKVEEAVYEGFGPEGSAIIIECVTDNRNRTISNLKTLLSKKGGALGSYNRVLWMFDKKGVIEIPKEHFKDLSDEAIELLLIDGGAEDIIPEKDVMGTLFYKVFIETAKLKNLQDYIISKGIEPSKVSLEYVPKELKTISEQGKSSLEKIFEALDEEDEVNDFYTNVKL